MTPQEEFEDDPEWLMAVPDGPPVRTTKHNVMYEFGGDLVCLPRDSIKEYHDCILVPLWLAGAKGLMDA